VVPLYSFTATIFPSVVSLVFCRLEFMVLMASSSEKISPLSRE